MDIELPQDEEQQQQQMEDGGDVTATNNTGNNDHGDDDDDDDNNSCDEIEQAYDALMEYDNIDGNNDPYQQQQQYQQLQQQQYQSTNIPTTTTTNNNNMEEVPNMPQGPGETFVDPFQDHHSHDNSNQNPTANATANNATANNVGGVFQSMTHQDPDHFGGMVHEVQQAMTAAAANNNTSFQQPNILHPVIATTTAATTDAATTTTTTTDVPQQPVPPQLVRSTPNPTLTGRFPILLYLSCDFDRLSPFQCAVRRNIEFFEATPIDVSVKIQGRNKPIVLGQVGIRCIHCKYVPPDRKCRGAAYYPHTLLGVYQASQILCSSHLMTAAAPGTLDTSTTGCPYVAQSIKDELRTLKAQKNAPANSTMSSVIPNVSGGKEYWAEMAATLGVYEDEHGLRFDTKIGHFICPKQRGVN